MFSPEYVQTSMAAAKALGYYPNSFRRGSYLRGLNLLLTYGERCVGRCAYCGLNAVRDVDVADVDRTFIRVRWPAYPVSDIIARLKEDGGQLQRVCVGMITHPRAFDDMNAIVHRFHTETALPISCLISPTVIRDPRRLVESREAGADIATVAIDAATPEIFERYRGREVHGPHRWQEFWDMLAGAAEVFGRGRIGVHLIVGLGETEQEMVTTIQRARDMGATTHLFSFFPEAGTSLDGLGQPSYGQYRRVQLARYLIDRDLARAQAMTFDGQGRIITYGVSAEVLEESIRFGEPFMTSGCPGTNGRTACNRPFGNERPGRPIRNYAFEPEVEDVALIRYQLADYDGFGDGRF